MDKDRKGMFTIAAALVAFGVIVALARGCHNSKYYDRPRELPEARLLYKNPEKNDAAHNVRMAYAERCANEDVGRIVYGALIGLPIFCGVIFFMAGVCDS